MIKQTVESTKNSYLDKRDVLLSALLEHQKEIEKQKLEVTSLTRIIADKRDEFAATKVAIPDIGHLLREREDILASIAIGNKNDTDLVQFDKQSEDQKALWHKAKTEAQRVTDGIDQALSGLTRKLDTATSLLATLNARNVELNKEFIMSEANLAGLQYIEAAKVVKELYLKLKVLGVLAQKHGHRATFHPVNPEFSLPTFNLPVFDNAFHKNWPGLITSEFLTDVFDCKKLALESVLEGFHSAGIKLIN